MGQVRSDDGNSDNRANSVQLELELGLSLEIKGFVQLYSRGNIHLKQSAKGTKMDVNVKVKAFTVFISANIEARILVW